jgi:hypothetical protein
MSDSEELRLYVEAFCHTAFEEPKEGRTFWAFHTREQEESLTADEVVACLEEGKGAFLVELVWDEDLELVERGEGRVMRSLDDLKKLAETRLKHLSDSILTRDPSLVATAQHAAEGEAMPKSKTSAPWHPSMMRSEKSGK